MKDVATLVDTSVSLPDEFPQSGSTLNSPASAALFDRLARATRRRIYNHAYSLLGNPMEAEDVTQDAYVRAWLHFDCYDPRRSFKPWLMRIVTNRVIDLRRRQKRILMVSLNVPISGDEDGQPFSYAFAAPDGDPARIVLGPLQEEQFTQALSALSPEYQRVIHLTAQECLSYEEIARRLNCPVGTVRSRIHRARVKLRQKLSAGNGQV